MWQIDWSFNQERPSWTEPDASLYENWTILKVQIEEELQPYVSEGDMMAVFVNGELRGMTTPATLEDETLTNKFLLKVYGNETGTETVHMSLQYYCQKLNQIFTLSDNIKLDSDQTTGIDEDFIPDFIFGSAKYPVVMLFDAEYLLDKANIEPAKGDLLAAFGVAPPPAFPVSYCPCSPIQYAGSVPKYRASRTAVSAEMPRRPSTISLMRRNGTCSSFARRYCESPRG